MRRLVVILLLVAAPCAANNWEIHFDTSSNLDPAIQFLVDTSSWNMIWNMTGSQIWLSTPDYFTVFDDKGEPVLIMQGDRVVERERSWEQVAKLMARILEKSMRWMANPPR